MPELIIDPQFCGPPGMGNGGYVAGLLAGHVGGSVEVTLRQPTPLATVMNVNPDGAGGMVLQKDDAVIAEARPAAFAVDVPEPPAYAEAQLASGRHPGLALHPVPGCFVCGTQRADGMRIGPGQLADRNLVATVWVPQPNLADPAGHVRPEFIWAVLDCPGAFAIDPEQLVPVLLGRLSARLVARVAPGGRYLITAWLFAVEGRKYFTGTALFTDEGELCACASATWIRLKDLSLLGS